MNIKNLFISFLYLQNLITISMIPVLTFLTGRTKYTEILVLNILISTMKDARCLAMILVLMEIILQTMPAVIAAVERSVPILKVGSILKTMIVLGT